MSVSLSPLERSSGEPMAIKPYFDCIKAHGIIAIFDLRQGMSFKESVELCGDGRYAGQGMIGGDYVGQNVPVELGYIKTATERIVINDDPAFYAYQAEYEGHQFLSIAFRNLPDGGALDPEGFELIMRSLDGLFERCGITYENMAFHCNGGLGRGPTMLTARVLWNEYKNAVRTGERDVDMTNILRRVIFRGHYARSTFIQNSDQQEALEDFSKHLNDRLRGGKTV
jgi:hypothetical protein